MSDESKPDEEPKLVIDTDWKEQVAKEKQQAEEAGEVAKEDVAKEDVTSSPGGSDSPTPPPASFEVLVSLLFTQAMGTLGHMPHPVSGEVEVNKPYAKHYIDTLEMLGEKTKGNLSDDESKMLSEALHALRMAYVGAKH